MENNRKAFGGIVLIAQFCILNNFYCGQSTSRRAWSEVGLQHRPVYLAAILYFCPIDFEHKFRTDVILKDKGSNAIFSDKVSMKYLQLPLFNKEADDCNNDFERWIYVLNNMETLTRLELGYVSTDNYRVADL